MLISREWLREFVDFDELSTEEFSELVTTRVAEVDCVHSFATPTEQALVVAVKSVATHPQNEKLKIVQIHTGSEQLQVVCGAPNVEANTLAAFLPPGAEFYAVGTGQERALRQIEARQTAGVESHGVLVSEAELGVTADHSGILLLDRISGINAEIIKPGLAVSAIIGGADTLIEIDNKSLTHRPDLWSHFGFAREISAILDRPLKFDADSWADSSAVGAEKLLALSKGRQALMQVRVVENSGCRRFAAIGLEGVSAAQSPFWMRRRLYAVGAGVRNILVDLSNYVMHELGQPNHAYDADKLSGPEIVVRRATSGEQFAALDGRHYQLDSEDIAICDSSGVVALGGIIGGGPSAVSESTKRLLLESANFDPVLIRRTAKRQQLRTDASNRFEKSLSPYAVPLALQRFVGLLCQIDSSVSVAGAVSDGFIERPQKLRVPFRPQYIEQRLGYALAEGRVANILTSLGFSHSESNSLEVPYYRATRDVSIEDDLVEEVGRISGYENVPELAPKIASVAAKLRPIADLEYQARSTLSAQGFSEVYLYSFMNGLRARQLGYDTTKAVVVENPVDLNENLIRTTLVPGLLRQLELNARNFSAIQLFEVGRAYSVERNAEHQKLNLENLLPNQAAFETRLLTIVYSSGQSESKHLEVGSPVVSKGQDFYALRTVLERLVAVATGGSLQLLPLNSSAGANSLPAENGTLGNEDYRSWMHPFRAAQVVVNGIALGVIAEVRPSIVPEIAQRAVVAEIDLELLIAARSGLRHFQPLPRFPFSLFEMSVVMPSKANYRQLQQLLEQEAPDGLLKRIEVVSVYEGKPLKDGEKSVSVKLYLGADDRTLSSEDLGAAQNKFMSAIAQSEFSLRA